jgi:hypothetical protein
MLPINQRERPERSEDPCSSSITTDNLSQPYSVT